MYIQIPNAVPQSSLESKIDQGPFVSVAEDGMVAAVSNEQTEDDAVQESSEPQQPCGEETKLVSGPNPDEASAQPKSDFVPTIEQTSGHATTSTQNSKPLDATSPVRRCLDLLRQQNRYSIWLLAYIAIVTSWPFLGSALQVLYRKKLRNVLPAALLRR